MNAVLLQMLVATASLWDLQQLYALQDKMFADSVWMTYTEIHTSFKNPSLLILLT